MPAKYTSNVGNIKAKHQFDNQYRLRRMIEDVHRYSNGITPMSGGKDRGHLRAGVLKAVEGSHATIEWLMPYASYQERGMRADKTHVVRHYTTPGTQAHFAEESVKKMLKSAYIYFGDWL